MALGGRKAGVVLCEGVGLIHRNGSPCRAHQYLEVIGWVATTVRMNAGSLRTTVQTFRWLPARDLHRLPRKDPVGSSFGSAGQIVTAAQLCSDTGQQQWGGGGNTSKQARLRSGKSVHQNKVGSI